MLTNTEVKQYTIATDSFSVNQLIHLFFPLVYFGATYKTSLIFLALQLEMLFFRVHELLPERFYANLQKREVVVNSSQLKFRKPL